jgi:hypothetical protein
MNYCLEYNFKQYQKIIIIVKQACILFSLRFLDNEI